MKHCPKCSRTYTDETLNFCLNDGEWLLAESDEPVTAILSEPGVVATGSSVSEARTRAKIYATESDAEPQEGLGGQPESRSLSAHRAAKLLVICSAAVLLSIGGFAAYRYFSSASVNQINSIAVMPFTNESGNVDNEYLADGMTESLITSLSQIPNLNVKARSSVFRYKGKGTDLRQVANELNVQAMLNGSVSQRGEHLILNLELVDPKTENVLWSEKYSRTQSDIILLQTEIARDVSNRLRIKLSGADEQKLAKNYTANPEAYRLYLQGRFFWNKRGKQNLEKAIRYFEQAIAVDPNYALAYTGLADVYSSAELPDYVRPREYALKALALDNNLAEAHTSLGTALLQYNYDFAGAENAYKRAIELNPNYVTAHQFYCRLLDAVGRHNEADLAIRRALEIEPLSLPVNWFYGIHLYVARDHEGSVRQLRKTIELDPGFIRGHVSLADALILNKNYAEAIEQLAKEQELEGNQTKAAYVREKCGAVSWQECWRTLTSKDSPVEVSPYTLARMFAEIGEKDKAFAELERSFEIRQAPFLRLKVDPRLDSLRGDPRYAELIKKVGFPE